MEKIIFRQDALDNVNELSELDELVYIIPRSAWVLGWILGFILLCLMLWLFLGVIPIKVRGNGVLIVENGTVKNLYANIENGIVQKLYVKPGEYVTKGDKIAEIGSSSHERQINIEEQYLSELQQKLDHLRKIKESSLSLYRSNFTNMQESLNKNINLNKKDIDELSKLIQKKNKNIKRGLETTDRLEDIKRHYYSANQALQQNIHQLKDLEISADNYLIGWHERIHQLELQVLESAKRVDNLIAGYEEAANIVADSDGKIIELHVTPGRHITNNQSVVSMVGSGDGLDVVAFIPAAKGKKTRAGMRALVVPSIVSDTEYGNLLAEVVDVNEYPASEEGAYNLLQNKSLLQNINPKESYMAVRVRVKRSDVCANGFAWTSKCPGVLVAPGGLAEVKITVDKQAPISLFIPKLKALFTSA